jgi:hypothetical protein
MATKAKKVEAVKEETVTINNKAYPVSGLSDTVKSLIAVHHKWQESRDSALESLEVVRLEVAKNEAALRDLAREIVELVEAPAEVMAE